MSSSQPRNVKIGDNERGGWSSDRPRRPGEPERPPRKQDVSVRGRVLGPTDRMRYSPGSLLLIACADRTLRDRFVARVIDEQSAVLSLDKVRALLAGKVAEDELDAKAQRAARRRRVQALHGRPDRRDPARDARRPRSASATCASPPPTGARAISCSWRPARTTSPTPTASRSASCAPRSTGASSAQEGFMTSLRLGGRMVEELKKIIFAPPPADD